MQVKQIENAREEVEVGHRIEGGVTGSRKVEGLIMGGHISRKLKGNIWIPVYCP